MAAKVAISCHLTHSFCLYLWDYIDIDANLTKCQTAYSLCENRVFTVKRNFGRIYAIFGSKIASILLYDSRMWQSCPPKRPLSTHKESPHRRVLAGEIRAKNTLFPVRWLSDRRQIAIGLPTDSCSCRRRMAICRRTDGYSSPDRLRFSRVFSPISSRRSRYPPKKRWRKTA